MKARLIAAVAGIVVGIVAGWFLRAFIIRKAKDFFGSKEFYALLETFFNEAAVLWFVFPLIDAIYKIRQPGEQQISVAIIVGTSWSAAGTFFYLAVNAKKNAEKKQAQKPQEGGTTWEISRQ